MALLTEPQYASISTYFKKNTAALAKQPWSGAPGALPQTLATLTPQAYNEIQYDANHSLWNNIPDRELDVQFFHIGMGFKRRIRMFSVDGESRQAHEIHFRPELFNYNNARVDTKQLEGKTDLGFAGFRAFKKPELARRNIVSFLGASSLRRPSTGYQHVVSPSTPSVMDRKSFQISPPSGLKRRKRKIPPLPATPYWMVPALPAPTSSSSTVKRSA